MTFFSPPRAFVLARAPRWRRAVGWGIGHWALGNRGNRGNRVGQSGGAIGRGNRLPNPNPNPSPDPNPNPNLAQAAGHGDDLRRGAALGAHLAVARVGLEEGEAREQREELEELQLHLPRRHGRRVGQ